MKQPERTSDRRLRFVGPGFALGALAAGLVFLLLPRDALAWGPLAHVDWTLRTVAGLTAVGAPLRRLLARHRDDFLYGSLAADIVLGKNLAKYEDHVHNWSVAFRVVQEAERQGDARHAFALGMASHLAADTVAHNYYVPWKTVASFDVPGTGHGYWEMRMDMTRPEAVWKAARAIDRDEHRHHEELLREQYVGQKLPWAVNERVFGAVLRSVAHKAFRPVVHLGLRRSNRPHLLASELREVETMVMRSIRGLLRDGDGARCVGSDAAGLRNLEAAAQLRRTLRRHWLRGDVDTHEARQFVERARAAFKESICGPLDLPALVV